MTYDEAKRRLEDVSQPHVLENWDRLTEDERGALLEQVGGLEPASIAFMQETLAKQVGESAGYADITPAAVVTVDQLHDAVNVCRGEQLLRDGQAGVIVVAGGQGSRLGYDGPKGAYGIGPVSGCSLFEIHSRKILALERKYDTQIPFYVMTSRGNDAPTRAFFAENDFFGLSSDRVLFFSQGMWPALSPEGKIILDAPGHIFMSPDGHGGILTALRKTGMIEDMTRRGLTTLFYFQVDNPLIDICDPAFMGIHALREADISIKVCAKRDPDEGLGVVVTHGAREAVVEYTELTDEQKNERLPDGNLRFRFGSVAIHVFSLAFLRQESEAQLPLHVAHKKVPYWDAQQGTVKPQAPNAFKFEKFIFDVVPDATRPLNVEFLREEEFSPVKNAEGNDSPATTARDMMCKSARWLEACGVDVPRNADGALIHRIEIDPCYAVTVTDLKARLPEEFALTADTYLR